MGVGVAVSDYMPYDLAGLPGTRKALHEGHPMRPSLTSQLVSSVSIVSKLNICVHY